MGKVDGDDWLRFIERNQSNYLVLTGVIMALQHYKAYRLENYDNSFNTRMEVPLSAVQMALPLVATPDAPSGSSSRIQSGTNAALDAVGSSMPGWAGLGVTLGQAIGNFAVGKSGAIQTSAGGSPGSTGKYNTLRIEDILSGVLLFVMLAKASQPVVEAISSGVGSLLGSMDGQSLAALATAVPLLPPPP